MSCLYVTTRNEHLGEHFTSISKVENYLYECYFHLYVTLVWWQCYITERKRNKNWNKTDKRNKNWDKKEHNWGKEENCRHRTIYNKHIIKWTNVLEKPSKVLIANFTYCHSSKFGALLLTTTRTSMTISRINSWRDLSCTYSVNLSSFGQSKVSQKLDLPLPHLPGPALWQLSTRSSNKLKFTWSLEAW